MKRRPDMRQGPMRNRKRSTCTGHGRVRKWGADWVPSMVVQPTGVVYSFLMECPIPSTKSKTRHREIKETETREKGIEKRKEICTQRKSAYIARWGTVTSPSLWYQL